MKERNNKEKTQETLRLSAKRYINKKQQIQFFMVIRVQEDSPPPTIAIVYLNYDCLNLVISSLSLSLVLFNSVQISQNFIHHEKKICYKK